MIDWYLFWSSGAQLVSTVDALKAGLAYPHLYAGSSDIYSTVVVSKYRLAFGGPFEMTGADRCAPDFALCDHSQR